MKKHRWIKSRMPLYKMEVPQNYKLIMRCTNCGLRKWVMPNTAYNYWRTFYIYPFATSWEEMKRTPPCTKPQDFRCEADPILRMQDDGGVACL